MLRAFWILVVTFILAASVIGWVEMTRMPVVEDAGYVPPAEDQKQADIAPGPLPFEDERLVRAARCTVYDMTVTEGFEDAWVVEYEALGSGELPVQTVETRAQGGDVTAMELLAFHFAHRGGEEALPSAGDWMLRAAQAGSTIAAQEVGFARIEGTLGLEIDVEAGIRWLRQASEAGDPIAMHNIGELYELGMIDPPEGLDAEDAALDAYLDAAAGCYDDSLEVIADRMKRGRGLPRDLEVAGWIDRNIRIYRN